MLSLIVLCWRFSDDQTRVLLKTESAAGDYINANYVNVSRKLVSKFFLKEILIKVSLNRKDGLSSESYQCSWNNNFFFTAVGDLVNTNKMKK